MADKAEEGKKEEVVEIQPDASGKYPETVPWKQYVGIKESLGKKLDAEKEKAKSLEEQLKTVVKPEDHKKVADELATIKADHEKTVNELKSLKESSASEKRNILKQKGVPEEEVKSMSEAELTAAVKVANLVSKPKLDMGTGGGSGALKGSPMDLAIQAYSSSNKPK